MAEKQTHGSKLMPWNWFPHEQKDVSNEQTGHPMVQLQRELDRFFDNSFRNAGLLSTDGSNASLLKPKLDISERDHDYLISAEIPGVSKEDIKLTQNGDQLVISGEKKHEHEEKNDQMHRIERSYGHFQRLLTLPADADCDGIKAEFKDGILNITVPRKPGGTNNGHSIDISG